MEYTRTEYFHYYRDTNKYTTDKKFDTLPEMLSFLADEDDGEEVEAVVRRWLKKRKGGER